MTPKTCDPPVEPDDHWPAFLAVQSWLDLQPLPIGIGEVELEIIKSRILFALLAELRKGRKVEYPKAWARTLLQHELGAFRKAPHHPVQPTDLQDLALAPEPATDPEPNVEDLWAWLDAHHSTVEARLSPKELSVLQVLRAASSVREAAARAELGLGNYRTIFRRIVRKLRDLVPPPPPSR